MGEELEIARQRLRIDEEDAAEIIINDEELVADPNTKLKLIGRLVSTKPLNLRSMANAFSSIWRTNKGFKVNEWGNGMFMIYFESERDKIRVLADAPWNYDRQLVILANFEGITQLAEVNLSSCEFWLRLSGIPFNCRGEKTIMKIASAAGRALKIDEESLNNWAQYIRVRISLDVQKPMKRVIKIRNGGGDPVIIQCQYEKLPNYCYICGIIGHVKDDCELAENDIEGEDWPYSPRMRATPNKLKSFNCGFKEKKGHEQARSQSESISENSAATRRQLFPQATAQRQPPETDDSIGQVQESPVTTNDEIGGPEVVQQLLTKVIKAVKMPEKVLQFAIGETGGTVGKGQLKQRKFRMKNLARGGANKVNQLENGLEKGQQKHKRPLDG